MTEIKDHIIYDLLEHQYDRVCLDYVIMKTDERYESFETHKRAIIEAFKILNHRFEIYDYTIDLIANKMVATPITISKLLEIPPEYYEDRKSKRERNYSMSKQIPYWYAFLEPPYGTSYQSSDFTEFNKSLFPNPEEIDAYRWNDDFSNYFDAGKEWWGTGLWTVFDKKTNIITVIGASSTD